MAIILMMTKRPAVKASLVIGSDNPQNEVLQEVKGHTFTASQPSSRNQPNQFKVQAESPIMGIDECCAFTGIARGTIYKLTSNRRIPHSKVGRRVMFLKDKILAWLAANEVEMEVE